MYVTCMNQKIHTQDAVLRKRRGRKAVDALPKAATRTALSGSQVDLEILLKEISNPPHGSKDSYLFKYEYLNHHIMSKYFDPALSDPDALRDVAIAKMKDTEQVCAGINQFGYHDPVVGHGWFEGVLYHAQTWIASVLGEYSHDIFEKARFSSGASTSRSRLKGAARSKYSNTIPNDVTPAALPYAYALVKSTPLWDLTSSKCRYNIVTGNRVSTVPKNSKTDRVIAFEPDMNMALQLAVGHHFRKSLKKVGLDLNDQTINQELAREGSITGLLATIDLSSASDSISYRLVMDLLPFEWFNILDKLRAVRGVLPDGETVVWEKFSSMGNGFTFELETLLFASLCIGVSKQAGVPLSSAKINRNFSVYGDDIIVPVSIADNLIEALRCVGFSTNTEKTFTTGPFRESCGAHFYRGTCVKPFYIRSPINTIQRLCWLVNRIRLWSYDRTAGIGDPTLYECWRYYTRLAPRRLRGGSSCERTDYIASPGLPGDRLKFVSKRYKHYDVASLLAAMQTWRNDTCVYRYPIEPDVWAPWDKSRFIDHSTTIQCRDGTRSGFPELVEVNTSWFTYSKNIEPVDKSSFMFFSNEII